MRRSAPEPHPAAGASADAPDLGHALATGAANRWLRGWNEGATSQAGWERFEPIAVQALPNFETYGIPVALVRGHDTGVVMVLFFAANNAGRYGVICLEPDAVGFDVTLFNPPVKLPAGARCEHQWHRMLEEKWHTTHVCKEPSGHDQGDHPTQHVCSCGDTLPPASQPA